MLSEPISTRKDRRITARKEQILKAAAQLFAEKGYHRTTTRDIAKAADVSEGTLYNYFESKNDLLFGILSTLVASQQIDIQQDEGLPKDARNYLTHILDHSKKTMMENRTMLQSIFSEILVNPDLRERFYHELVQPMYDLVEQHLIIRKELNQIRQINLSLTVRILYGMLLGLIMLEFIGDEKIFMEWDQLVQSFSTIFFEGVNL